MTETAKKPQFLAKEAEVAALKEMIANAQGVVLVDYRGITVEEDTKLRKNLREAGAEYKVAKNTLIKIACHQNGIECLDEHLEGTTGIACSADAPSLAKTFSQFMTASKKMAFKGGLLDGEYVDVAKLDALAKLPSRDALLGQFAGCCAAMMRQFMTAIERIKEQKEENEATA